MNLEKLKFHGNRDLRSKDKRTRKKEKEKRRR